MFRPKNLFRLIQINKVLAQHTFNRSVLGAQSTTLRWLSYLNPWSFFRQKHTRGESIRTALEELGPIFVKFGQLLSIRNDILPDDIVEELEKLQDRVAPFSSKLAIQKVEDAFGKKLEFIFSEFEPQALASASVAQVHAARLPDGKEVIVKILRPKIEKIIRRDIAILYFIANLTEKLWSQGRRLHPVDLVAEFEQTIIDELDLLREAANASQLRRNFANSSMLYVPEIHWDYCHKDVMVMERIYGVPIADTKTLHMHGTNMKKLAEYGVEIFFTQVLRDSFFHADMHPGNLFVDIQDPKNPKYIGVDFGIMGSLSPQDQHYIAANLLAFFRRDYRQVAILHVESNWVPVNTRIDQFEAAIRTVCEPIFEKPLKEISFAKLLLRLFQTAERFQMEMQPQLMLLQKTLLGVEGLGRRLYPDLDLWETAKPFLTRWIRSQRSLRHIGKSLGENWQEDMVKISRTPQLAYNILSHINTRQRLAQQTPVVKESKINYILIGVVLFVISGLFTWAMPWLIKNQIIFAASGFGLGLLLILISVFKSKFE